MGETEDQALTIHTKRNQIKREDHHHNKKEDQNHKRQRKPIRDISSVIGYTCDEKGHYSKDCPRNIQSYFTRVSQMKEQLEAVEEKVEEGEIVMTTLNGLPRSWDSFIQGICARKKLITFSRLWEECTQEEARLITREDGSN